MNQPAPSMPSGSIAQEVQRLIAQARKGQALDIELTGHAYDVLESLHPSLDHQPDLFADLERRVTFFAQKTGTAQMYLHALVTDQQPDLQDYDPSQVFVYDGISDGGVDFSSADVRATIYGTVMTSVNVSDLAAYFRSGQKRVLVVHLGTEREQDSNALDSILTQLPALLEAAGLNPEQIAAVMAVIKSGNLSPAILKTLHVVAQIAQIKSGIKGAMPPETAVRIQALSKAALQMIGSPAMARGSSPVLIRALTVLKPVIHAISAVPARPLGMSIRARNDNHLSKTTTAVPEIRKLVTAIRTISRDKKTLTLPQRRELAVILRDLRVTARASTMTVPQFTRVQAGLVRAQHFIAQNLPVIAMAPVLPALLPPVLMAAAVYNSPTVLATYKNVMAPIIAQIPLMPPAVQAAIRPALEQPAIRGVVRVLEAQSISQPIAADKIIPPLEPVANKIIRVDIEPIPVPASTPENTPPCCRLEFKKIVGELAQPTITGPEVTTAPRMDAQADGSVIVRRSDGTESIITGTEIETNTRAHAELTRDLALPSVSGAADQQKWHDDTRRTLDTIARGETPDGIKNTFEHVCGPGCPGHVVKGSDVPSGPILQDVPVEIITTKSADTDIKPSGRRPRTMRPA